MITREEALLILRQNIQSESMIRHSIASEAVMRGLAIYVNENPEIWGLSGLLHDIDVEITGADPKTHGTMAPVLLKKFNLPPEMTNAIVMHNEEAAPRSRQTKIEHALAAGETITGLITATTYVYPNKKIRSVKSISIIKRMKEKHFAASVKRENILECEKIGIPLDQFVEISLCAMQAIAGDIGL